MSLHKKKCACGFEYWGEDMGPGLCEVCAYRKESDRIDSKAVENLLEGLAEEKKVRWNKELSERLLNTGYTKKDWARWMRGRR